MAFFYTLMYTVVVTTNPISYLWIRIWRTSRWLYLAARYMGVLCILSCSSTICKMKRLIFFWHVRWDTQWRKVKQKQQMKRTIRFSTLVPPTLVMRELRIWCDAFLHRLWCLYWDNSCYSCFPWLEKATTNSLLSPFPSHEKTTVMGKKFILTFSSAWDWEGHNQMLFPLPSPLL